MPNRWPRNSCTNPWALPHFPEKPPPKQNRIRTKEIEFYCRKTEKWKVGGRERRNREEWGDEEEEVAPGGSIAVSLGPNMCVIGHSGHSTRKESEARRRLSS